MQTTSTEPRSHTPRTSQTGTRWACCEGHVFSDISSLYCSVCGNTLTRVSGFASE